MDLITISKFCLAFISILLAVTFTIEGLARMIERHIERKRNEERQDRINKIK